MLVEKRKRKKIVKNSCNRDSVARSEWIAGNDTIEESINRECLKERTPNSIRSFSQTIGLIDGRRVVFRTVG